MKYLSCLVLLKVILVWSVQESLDTFELEKYSKKNLILAVKSGLTGLAQISGRRNLSYEEKRRIDLYYVQNWTFWGDIIILIKTVWVVLFHQGAA